MNRTRPDHDFEAELRSALQRVNPAPGFADRVVARVKKEQRGGASGLWERMMQPFRLPVFRVATSAALCVAVVFGYIEHQRNERERGEAAKQQLMLAMRVTGAKLQKTQKMVNRVHSHQYGPQTQTEE
jgi:hypothetical protein